MMEVKKKYVYESDKLNNFYGMMPLDMYVSMIYFNYNKHEFINTLISIYDLIDFITECFVETLLSEIKFNGEFQVSDVYLSATPSLNSDSVKKTLLIFCSNKKIIVSENKIEGQEGIRMRNQSKESMMTTVLSSHKLAARLVTTIIDRCDSCKKVSVIGIDSQSQEEIQEEVKATLGEKIEVHEKGDNKFDLRNYQRI